MGFFSSISQRPALAPAQKQTLDGLKAEIDRGVKDGTLTSGESQKLYTQLSQLQAQMQVKPQGGWGGMVANAVNAQKVNAATASLTQNINSLRANGDVDLGKLMNSNIGQVAQQIQQLSANIQQGAANGTLSPKEQFFLNAKLGGLQQAFTNAIKNDGKLDAGEQAQLNGMMRGLAAETFMSSFNHQRPNPFGQYLPPANPNAHLAVVTKALPEENGGF